MATRLCGHLLTEDIWDGVESNRNWGGGGLTPLFSSSAGDRWYGRRMDGYYSTATAIISKAGKTTWETREHLSFGVDCKWCVAPEVVLGFTANYI